MYRFFLLIFAVFTLVAFSYIDWNVSEEPGETEEARDPRVTAEEVVAEEGLYPLVEEAKEELLARAAARNIDVVITEGYRSHERQDDLYAQGRTSGGDIVTHAAGGESYHNYGLALDYALQAEDGSLIWDVDTDFNGSGTPDWLEVAEIAKDLGFEWGGDWTNFLDYPHIQMTFGLTIQELQLAEAEKDNSEES
ncbi:M15 family metallopeptidase [Alkalicoccus daliensis]|uniref:Peptidoglycan L-alanyl-D-glutamate endopeptidase CwlK n=1 Tax=Alkalicoccus daliensis TaxID=745820 RepID=A0A1H0JZQ6_9BACI|nr:M15 family metallopeptidase [Alkalicoccus daliensis]SDO49144.1 peptidoglycan L-alanyl-D-glutamate endopeptidase CwlK [Alkalicoccus daliensis]